MACRWIPSAGRLRWRGSKSPTRPGRRPWARGAEQSLRRRASQGGKTHEAALRRAGDSAKPQEEADSPPRKHCNRSYRQLFPDIAGFVDAVRTGNVDLRSPGVMKGRSSESSPQVQPIVAVASSCRSASRPSALAGRWPDAVIVPPVAPPGAMEHAASAPKTAVDVIRYTTYVQHTSSGRSPPGHRLEK